MYTDREGPNPIAKANKIKTLTKSDRFIVKSSLKIKRKISLLKKRGLRVT